jgi:hypothetical protein
LLTATDLIRRIVAFVASCDQGRPAMMSAAVG